MVPPVFWGKMAYFYLSSSDVTVQPQLKAYQWNDLTNEFEEKCSKSLPAEASLQNLYHKFSMVQVGNDGIIFSQWTTGTFKMYKCAEAGGIWSYTETTVDITNTLNALTGD